MDIVRLCCTSVNMSLLLQLHFRGSPEFINLSFCVSHNWLLCRRSECASGRDYSGFTQGFSLSALQVDPLHSRRADMAGLVQISAALKLPVCVIELFA